MAFTDSRHDGPRRRPAALIVTVALVCGAAALVWWLSRPLDEVSAARRRFAELERQITAARDGQAGRSAARGQVLRLQAQARAADPSQRAAFEQQATAVEARLGWGDPAVVREAVLGRSLLPLTPAAPPAGSPAPGGSGCRACHLAIDTAGYDAYPQPFRTHPNLSAYVGRESPHPVDRFECTACHGGREDAATFAAAGHPVEESGVQLASLDAAAAAPRMLVLRQTEASCASCHVGERYLPGAQRFDTALTRFERGGCYACHAAAAFDDVHKRGPDLRRIRGKLTPEWVRAWLRNPRAVKPNSMMPRFWGATADANAASSSVVVTQADEEEIAAVTAYLFSTGEPYSPAVSSPPRGDAARGAQVLRDVGCLGCHIVGDEPAPPGTRRSFGQPLQSLAGKVSYAWLYDWVRHPARFSPSTLMPDLRLTDRDAADVASYLTTLGGSALAPAGDVRRSDAVLRAQARRQTEGLPPSLVGTADLEALSGETLHVELGRRIVARLGCFNCHEIRGFEDAPRTATPLPAGRAWSADDLARLHAGVDPGDDRRGRRAPVYVIDGPLREQFALALTAVTRPAASGRIAASPAHEVRTAGRALVQRRNCVGCHTIEGTGGDFVQLVAEPSLGPPLLTPEGARVQAAWLRAFLGGPITIRPWLAVRMPTFGLGDAEVGAVSEYFRAIAVPNPAPQTAGAVPSPDAGRELFELLKCQQCHVLGSIPKDQPTSNLAPDLRMAHERLQPEWILAWLENPSAILPGTRMPSFWPDYPKSFYPPLDRDGARQIRAIRDHLLTLRGGPSPQR